MTEQFKFITFPRTRAGQGPETCAISAVRAESNSVIAATAGDQGGLKFRLDGRSRALSVKVPKSNRSVWESIRFAILSSEQGAHDSTPPSQHISLRIRLIIKELLAVP